MAVTSENEAQFILCAQSERDRMTRIGQIITALENQMILAATKVDVQDYSLNDGQVTIRTAYRSPREIAKAIRDFELIYNTLANRCRGRIYTFKSARAFNLLQRYGEL